MALMQKLKLRINVNETYLLNSKLILRFLAKNGFNNSFNADAVSTYVDTMKKEWLDHDIEYITQNK
jgi:hypothetical protein